NLSKKYEKELRAVDEALLLPKTELGMLQTLHTEDKPLRATVIAGELDCSYQLIGKRGKNLAEQGLVERSVNEEGKRIFEITDRGEKIYFDVATPSALNIPG